MFGDIKKNIKTVYTICFVESGITYGRLKTGLLEE